MFVPNNIQKEIIRHVILAQAASDSGKGIIWKDCRVPGYDQALQKGYLAKSSHELSAIRLIDSNPPCGITYFVGGDHESPMVYFKFDGFLGNPVQVSFHNPKIHKNSNLLNYYGRGERIIWNGNRYPMKKGTGSRKICKKLIHLCGW